jgi:tripartite-type tricarboxylate transporter receptor subunit TctC
MTLSRRTLLRLAGSLAACPVLPLAAQDFWPSRPIRLLIGTAPGGSPDIIGRILGEKLEARLGQSFVVENNSQAAGAVAQQLVAKSAPDGYTMIMLTGGYPPQMALRKNPPFDPLNGFSFVTIVCGYPMVYAVVPDSPIKSFKHLLDEAKGKPGRITYTINALGSVHHVLTKWIEMEAGIEMTPIPYRGAGPAFTDVIGGRVDVMVEAATSAFPRIQQGQLRVLALSSAERYPLMPDAPVVAETVSGIEFMSWLGLAMAAGTPRPIVDRLNGEVRDALTLPDVRQRLIEGGNVATPSTPEDMRARVEREMARWTRVIEASGLKTE